MLEKYFECANVSSLKKNINGPISLLFSFSKYIFSLEQQREALKPEGEGKLCQSSMCT